SRRHHLEHRALARAGPVKMLVGLPREDLQRAGRERPRAVGMPAGAAATDLRDPARELLPLVAALRSRQPLDGGGNRSRTLAAWPALAGARIREIPKSTGGLADPAGVRRQDDDRAGAEPGASRAEVGIEQACLLRLALAEPRPEESSDQEGTDVA